MGSESISDMFQKHLLENANLHYGEFMKDLSRLIVSKNYFDFGQNVLGVVLHDF
jgi:hypothetical protein